MSMAVVERILVLVEDTGWKNAAGKRSLADTQNMFLYCKND
jgi:hypothetical protein